MNSKTERKAILRNRRTETCNDAYLNERRELSNFFKKTTSSDNWG
jgi:hypothetical protein